MFLIFDIAIISGRLFNKYCTSRVCPYVSRVLQKYIIHVHQTDSSEQLLSGICTYRELEKQGSGTGESWLPSFVLPQVS